MTKFTGGSATMHNEPVSLAVVIPYFQREPGILRRALMSILHQTLPANVRVEVIVVDDASPVPAEGEIKDLNFSGAITLKLLKQSNGGPGAARNRGLDAVDPSAHYVAFLDSDDAWYPGHLTLAIAALEQGHDFYFCDNRREGHHEAFFSSYDCLLAPYIKSAAGRDVVTLSTEEMYTIALREFPTQASTTLFRRAAAPDLRFERSLRSAGEDLVFFLQLISKTKSVCFSPKVMVDCGKGVNIYFGQIDWNAPGYLKGLADNLRAYLIVRETVAMSASNTAWIDRFITKLRRDLVFHTLRRFVKGRGKWPREIGALKAYDKKLPLWFAACAVYVTLGRAARFYKPG